MLVYCVLGRCTVCYGGVLYVMVFTVCYGGVLYVRASVLYVRVVYCMLGRCIVCYGGVLYVRAVYCMLVAVYSVC